MRILIFGGSGMLGQALIKAGQKIGHEIIAPPRWYVNLTEDSQIEDCIQTVKPGCVINAAAMIDFTQCEENPRSAYIINARPVATIANCCRRDDIDLVQISSDQCGGPLLNEYAKSKAAGETFALSIPNALVVRTNIVGPKNLAWAFQAIEEDEPCTLWNDYTVSSIDIWSFSEALFEIIAEPSAGIINLASSETFSKETFVRALANAMNCELTHAESVPMPENANRHPNLGMDVSLAENWLKRKLPTLTEVIDRIVIERRNIDENRKSSHQLQ